MPIYEYRCRRCGHEFEALVRSGSAPSCEVCASEELERLLSSFAASSDATREANLRAVRQRGARLRRDKIHEDHRYMHKHMKDH